MGWMLENRKPQKVFIQPQVRSTAYPTPSLCRSLPQTYSLEGSWSGLLSVCTQCEESEPNLDGGKEDYPL